MSSRRSIVLVTLAATTWLGCATEPGDPPATESSVTEASTTAFANDKAAYDFFVGKGLTNFQAAGIVGNLDQESGVNPASVQGGGPGRGIAQWSVGGRWDTTPNANVRWYAANQGQPALSLDLQLKFIWFELTQIGYGYAALKATTNVTDATIAFMAKYEICGACASAQRVAYAKAVLAAYGATPAYGATFVSQSWPLATTPMTLHCGEQVAATIVVKNTGSKAWDGATRLGTTMPRDRASGFADADWLAPNRAAAIAGAVAPGANGTFRFSFRAPSGAACVPGTYHEHFGLLEEGAAWFSDGAQSGPPDDQIEALIEVVAAAPGAPADAGVPGNGDAAGAPDQPGDGKPGAGCAAGRGGGGAAALVLVALGTIARRRRAADRA
jgi:hypothetical protein